MEAPEFYQNSSFCPQFISEKLHSNSDTNNTNKPNAVDPFVVEDLLDFTNDDAIVAAEAAFDSVTGNSTDSSSVTVVDTCNSSSLSGSETTNFVGDIGCRNTTDNHFSSELCVPYDDLAELEWLSNFVEESFSSEDLQKLQLISGMKSRSTTVVDEASDTRQFQSEPNRNASVFYTDVSVPAKARSKRSRPAPCNWTSRLLLVSPTTTTTTTTTSETTSSSELDVVVSAPPLLLSEPCTGKKTVKNVAKKKEGLEGGSVSCEGRKCLHCATDKTPQWRTGPMGPKTLCNACGVRYKSGRLVPEYRPASSPTFVLTKHSNSHRKVLELRRQKEMLRHHQHQQFLQQPHHQNMVFDVSPNGDDYLIHQHAGPDFRQLI